MVGGMSVHEPDDGDLEQEIARVREADRERPAERRAAERADAPADGPRAHGIMAHVRALLAHRPGTRHRS